jgi:hypothetical protein
MGTDETRMRQEAVKKSWLVLIGAAMLIFGSGCAGSRSGDAAWLKLPSPWSTIRQSATVDMPSQFQMANDRYKPTDEI